MAHFFIVVGILTKMCRALYQKVYFNVKKSACKLHMNHNLWQLHFPHEIMSMLSSD